MASGIYYIRNIITNKYYIGQSININKRISEHFNNLRKNNKYRVNQFQENSHLQYSFNKHKEENFEWGILEKDILSEDLTYKEQYYINLIKLCGYQTYNQTSAHNNKSGSGQCKSVCQFNKKTGELIKTWNSIAQAARDLKITDTTIIDSCRLITSSAHGYTWRYNDGTIYNSEQIILESINPRCKPVIQIDKDTNKIIKEWKSIKDAAIFYNTDRSFISKVCKGKQKTAVGYLWQYN